MASNPENTKKSVESAEDILAELKLKAEDAHKANDVFLMSLMTELLKVTSPIVTKAIARYHREERSRINQLHSELRTQAQAEREKEREAKAAAKAKD